MRIFRVANNNYSKTLSFRKVLPSAIDAAIKQAEESRVPEDIKGYKKDLGQIEKLVNRQRNNHVCNIGYDGYCDNFILINTDTSEKISWHSSKSLSEACERADKYSKETHRRCLDSKITKWVGRSMSKLFKK